MGIHSFKNKQAFMGLQAVVRYSHHMTHFENKKVKKQKGGKDAL
jgi:hypothetical protein